MTLHHAVTMRDSQCCRVCWTHSDGDYKVEAHHITPGLPNDGMVIENLISLCPRCHKLAEAWLNTNNYPTIRHLGTSDRYHPDNLYRLINSSYEIAFVVAGAAG